MSLLAITPAPVQSGLGLVNDRITANPWLAWLNRQVYPILAQAARSVISDTAANRSGFPASSYSGSLFIETDRRVIYQSNGVAWLYLAGEYVATLAHLPTLTADDAGFLFGVSDYGHLLRWSGTVWDFAPGDPGSGMQMAFPVAPGLGWHLCDGTTVTYLKGDGTTGTVALSSTAGTYFRL